MTTTSDVPKFVPVSEWPTLEEMADGFREHLMPSTSKLTGKNIEHTFDNGYKISHIFGDAGKLTWNILEGKDKGLTGEAEYEAYEVRPDIFLIDFYKPAYEEQVTLVLDISTGQCIAGVSGFHNLKGERRTWTKFMNANAQGINTVASFPETEELIGKHILYRYTPRDAYEHIYLNKGTFTWHCLDGTEKGLADAEECKMLKLRDNLFLLFWTETIMPVESIVVIDLEHMRSTGRFYCWDPKPQRPVHVRFGSYATVLADTKPLEALARASRVKQNLLIPKQREDRDTLAWGDFRVEGNITAEIAQEYTFKYGYRLFLGADGVGFSLAALHHLDHVPKSQDGVDHQVLLKRQAHLDLLRFLKLRADEIVQGDSLVLSFVSQSSSGRENHAGLVDACRNAMIDMVKDGTLPGAVAGSFYVPTYNRTLQDVQKVVKEVIPTWIAHEVFEKDCLHPEKKDLEPQRKSEGHDSDEASRQYADVVVDWLMAVFSEYFLKAVKVGSDHKFTDEDAEKFLEDWVKRTKELFVKDHRDEDVVCSFIFVRLERV
ncbi:hypothetical protein BHE90_000342 [Fusarium euwallaceae]|uniref:Uncharacterized protein n=1 Tax=Fusarium euwallaceae TaxID=1147111 RepID=A0A430MB17_9HYPO|nr:hypothetical protein BHE90_000342 [Fusarium euwallaceae]